MGFSKNLFYWTPKIQDGGSPPSWILAPKGDFLKNQNNLELWSLLTTYRKSYMGFSKNPLWNPYNPRWRKSAILDVDTNMQKWKTKLGGPNLDKISETGAE